MAQMSSGGRGMDGDCSDGGSIMKIADCGFPAEAAAARLSQPCLAWSGQHGQDGRGTRGASFRENEAGKSEAAAEGVLDVLGEDAVDGVGLVAGQDGEPSGGAVGFDVEDVLHDAEEAGVERDAVGEGTFAAPAYDAAPGGSERDLRFLIKIGRAHV